MSAVASHVYGGVAQLGERTVRIRKVESSILFVSISTAKSKGFAVFCMSAQRHIQNHHHAKPGGKKQGSRIGMLPLGHFRD